MARPGKKHKVLTGYLDRVRRDIPSAEVEVLQDPPQGADFLLWIRVPDEHLMEAIDSTSTFTTHYYADSGVYVDVRVSAK